MPAGLMLGMVSGLDRKNCWTIAEHRGQATPDGLQHLLSRAKWDADAVRDDLRDYVIDAFGDPDAVLVVDETGDVKKGTAHGRRAAPVHRHRGPDRERPGGGVSDLCRPRGHALIDRALYLPNRGPRTLTAATTLESPLTGGVSQPNPLWRGVDRPRSGCRGSRARGWPAMRSTARTPSLRAAIRGHGLGYVLAVAANRRIPTAAGPIRVDADPRTAAGPGLAEALRRGGQPRAPHLLLGLDRAARRRRHRHRPPSPADPAQRPHRRARLPTLLQPGRGAAGQPGHRRRATLAHRGILPSSQRTHRAGSAPTPPLDLLAPLDHPGHARSRLPGRGHRRRTRHLSHPRPV